MYIAEWEGVKRILTPKVKLVNYLKHYKTKIKIKTKITYASNWMNEWIYLEKMYRNNWLIMNKLLHFLHSIHQNPLFI